MVPYVRRRPPGPATGRIRRSAGILEGDEMVAWPVSTRVGNVKNNDPSLMEPATRICRRSRIAVWPT